MTHLFVCEAHHFCDEFEDRDCQHRMTHYGDHVESGSEDPAACLEHHCTARDEYGERWESYCILYKYFDLLPTTWEEIIEYENSGDRYRARHKSLQTMGKSVVLNVRGDGGQSGE